MALKVSNNASSTLAGSLAAIDTTLSVATAEGARFPTLGAGDWFPLTLVKLVAGVPTIEIVKVTARAGDVLTVVREQEGTTGLTFSAGDRAELRLTAAALDEFIPVGLAATLTGAETLTNKSLSDSTTYIIDQADDTKKAQFQASGITAGQTRVITIPDENMTLAGRAANTFTGKQAGTEVSMANYIDKTVTNATSAGTVTLDCDTADLFELTLSGNTSVALSNLPALSSETFTLVVRVSQGATPYTLNWFSTITWLTSGGTAPAAPSANKTIEYVFTTKDGTNWLGRKGAAN